MKKIVFRKFVFGITVFCLQSIYIFSQEIVTQNNCEYNLVVFQGRQMLRIEGTKIIVIARRGSKEKSNIYGETRLNIFRKLLGDDRGVFAIGKKAKNKPQVEIYINGKLELVFETKNKEKLKLGNCEY